MQGRNGGEKTAQLRQHQDCEWSLLQDLFAALDRRLADVHKLQTCDQDDAEAVQTCPPICYKRLSQLQRVPAERVTSWKDGCNTECQQDIKKYMLSY